MKFVVNGYNEKKNGIDVTCSICRTEQTIPVSKLLEQKLHEIDCINCDSVCITCVRKFITKECDNIDRNKCKTCEYNTCKNCTQHGNIECDAEKIVPVSLSKNEESNIIIKDINIGEIFTFKSIRYLRIKPIESLFVKTSDNFITAVNLKTFVTEFIPIEIDIKK